MKILDNIEHSIIKTVANHAKFEKNETILKIHRQYY